MNNMIVDNFKERREIKIENDANIKNKIFKQAKRQASEYSITYQYQNQTFSQQQRQSQLESQIRRQFRNISNRRYACKFHTFSYKKAELIMDYDFSIQ